MTTTDPKLIEPVAWIIENKGRSEKLLSEKPLPRGADELGWTETPLYTAAAINEAAHQWQDIATAPRDGSVILAYRPDAGVFTAHYVEEDAHLSNAMNPPEGDCYWFTTGGEDLTEDMPTHWQPLPSPPAIEAEESQHG